MSEKIKSCYVVLSIRDLRGMTRRAIKLAKAKPHFRKDKSFMRECVVIRNIDVTDILGKSQISSWDIANPSNMSIV